MLSPTGWGSDDGPASAGIFQCKEKGEVMRMAIANLLELGITNEEMMTMVQRNPAVLLDLEG
jgi:hypothetical protein